MTGNETRNRVAVIGASGIGKHHANWWNMEGAEVCAFAGTSTTSVAQTAGTLHQLFGFKGHGYTHVEGMLQNEKPDIVDVCSPPDCHFEHVKQALLADCDVLCEKPFVYDPKLPRTALLEQASELVQLANSRKRKLGLCVQYVVCARMIRELWKRDKSHIVASRYRVHLASPAKGREPDPERVWIDLGPHPLSGLQELSHNGEVRWDVLETQFEGYEARASFVARRPTGEAIDCEIITANTTDGPSHIREVTLDDTVYVIGGEKGEDGVYRARIDADGESHVQDDFMRVVIREFLHGHPVAEGEDALVNLDWLLRIREAARQS